jgi:hypothetical protein
MPARRTSDLTILIVAFAATALLSVTSFLISPVDSSPAVDGSSFAAHPGGGRAAFLGLKAAGYDVQPSYEPLTAVRAMPAESVLVLADPIVAPSVQDIRALAGFLEAGGVVLATGPHAFGFLPGLPPSGAAANHSEATVVSASIPSQWSAGVPEIVMTPASSALPGDSRFLAIFGTAERPAVAAARFGNGRAIWWAASTPLTNASITAPGHVDLLLNVLGPPGERVVVWDEHYHGHTRSFLSYLAGTPMPFAGAQLGLVLLMALLTFSRRRWPVRAQYVEPRTSPLEFVDSMGTLYDRANASTGAVATVRARVRRALVSACGLPSGASDEQLTHTAAARVSMDGPTLQAVLTSSAEAARNPNLSPADARTVVARLQRIGAALKSSRRRV